MYGSGSVVFKYISDNACNLKPVIPFVCADSVPLYIISGGLTTLDYTMNGLIYKQLGIAIVVTIEICAAAAVTPRPAPNNNNNNRISISHRTTTTATVS